MICLDGVEMPKNCYECDSFGISDIVGLKCPCELNPEAYDYESRPNGCPLHEEGQPTKQQETVNDVFDCMHDYYSDKAFKDSIKKAIESGVSEDDILHNIDKIDFFFVK